MIIRVVQMRCEVFRSQLQNISILNHPSVLNVKAVVATFNQEKALVGAFSVITNLRMDLFEALVHRGIPGDTTRHAADVSVNMAAVLPITCIMLVTAGS